MSRRRSESAVRSRTNSNAESLPSRPMSPSGLSSTTNASQLHLDTGPETIITRRDLRQSINAYEDLVADCQAYREALTAMSNAASRFAFTFERCSRLKGVDDDAAIGLQAAGGLHHLMGNHWQILSMTLLNGFEDPLRAELDQYKRTVSGRSAAYEKMLVEKSKLIKKTEAESIDTGRRKQRDLQAFRRTLAALQTHVDDLDRLKAEHYQDILEHECKTWDNVMDKAALAVRSELDLFERLSAKASDPMLEPIMQSVLDPFESYSTKSENEIFSILPPLSIANPKAMASGTFSSSPALNGHVYVNGGNNRNDSFDQTTPSAMQASHSWADDTGNAWSNYRSQSPSSSDSVRRYSVPESPPRRPSSPPSTGTLRRSETKPRPNLEDVLSSDTIKGSETLEAPSLPRKDSSRRDTIIAPRPQPPQPEPAHNEDDTIRITTTERKSTLSAPNSKKGGFAHSFSRFISPSSASTGPVDKVSG